MASIPASPDNLTGYPDQLDVNHMSAAEFGPGEPPLFRFRLRQLLYFVAVVSFILAATVLSHGVAALAMLLAALVVAAHLFSTALATGYGHGPTMHRHWDACLGRAHSRSGSRQSMQIAP